jgi:hypothetical protein
MAIAARRMQDLKCKFAKFDVNGDHKLTFNEVKEFQRSLHLGASECELKASFDAADANHDGFLNFHEFLCLSETAQRHVSFTKDSKKSPGREAKQQADRDFNASRSDDQEAFRIHDEETFQHWMQRVVDEHPDERRRKSSFRHTATAILELQQEQRRSAMRAEISDHAQTSSSERMPRASTPRSARSSTSHPSWPHSKKEIRGPEHFFYDKATYTGTSAHGHGGPLAAEQGRPKRVTNRMKGLDELLGNLHRPGTEDTSKNGPRFPDHLYEDKSAYTGVSKFTHNAN